MVSGAGNDSRFKKSKLKGNLKFAKDKNQAILAIFVFFLFFATTIYNIAKYSMEQNPQQQIVNQNTSSPLADEVTPRQQNPENLAEQNQNIAQDANDIYSQTVDLQKNSSDQNPKTVQSPEGDIEIISKKTPVKKNEKLVLISVANSGRSDPFLPAGEVSFSSSGSYSYLPPPPENLPTNTDAGKVMTTTISGILYDKYSPSAIINIEGTDYLVKRGDVINNYKILSIGKINVIVQLGKNIYQAGVGELLSPTDLNYNTIANLNKKFGGNDVSINVRKKGY